MANYFATVIAFKCLTYVILNKCRFALVHKVIETFTYVHIAHKSLTLWGEWDEEEGENVGEGLDFLKNVCLKWVRIRNYVHWTRFLFWLRKGNDGLYWKSGRDAFWSERYGYGSNDMYVSCCDWSWGNWAAFICYPFIWSVRSTHMHVRCNSHVFFWIGRFAKYFIFYWAR